jgi:hypothetical protein
LSNPVNYFDPNGAQTEAALATCAVGGPLNPGCDAAIIINACKYVGLGVAAAWGYFSNSEENEDCDEGCEQDETERCKKVLSECIVGCSELVLRKKNKGLT